jgi:hypothetical protein
LPEKERIRVIKERKKLLGERARAKLKSSK